MADEKKSVKGGPVSIDFTGVEAGGGRPRVPEDDYGFRITSCVMKKGKESGKAYFLFGLKVIKGNSKGLNKIIQHRCSLSKDALWNLRNLLEAAGINVPSKAVKIDPTKLVGKELAGTCIDEEYEGKKHSIISAFFPMADLVPTEATGGKTKKKETEEADEESGGEETAEEAGEESAEEESADEDAEELFS